MQLSEHPSPMRLTCCDAPFVRFDIPPVLPEYPFRNVSTGDGAMAVSDQVSKAIYYLRARREDAPFDLQAIIVKARKKKKTVADSEVELGGGDVVRIQHYKATQGQLLLHLARYVPGVAAATLQPKAAAEEDDEGTQPAPKGKEFKEGDCFLLVKGAHVLYCGHGISLPKAALYLLQYFREAGLYDDASGFDLAPATKLDKLKLVQEHGVRAVQLQTNAFFMSLPKKKRTTWAAKTLGQIGDELKALAKKDKTDVEQRALEDLLVNVEVRLDGNTRAQQGAQDFIEDVAELVLDDKEAPVSEFVIVTQKNERITSGSIRIQTSVKVERKENSVSHNSVWGELGKYLDVIQAGNLLEQ